MADYKDMIRETLNNINDKAKDLSENAAERAREISEAAAEWAKEVSENTAERAREFSGAASERAREFSETANEKARSFAENENVRNLYERGAGKAKRFGSNAKTAFEANGINEELKKAYMEIGKLFYEETKDAPEEFYEPLFRKVSNLNETLDELNRKLYAEEQDPEPETVIAEEVVTDDTKSE